MFYVYADGKSIYEPLDDELIISSPKLTLEMGKAGSFQFSVPPNHLYYTLFQQLKTIITVELDGVEIFRGRVLTVNRSFNNTRSIYCEGNLAYLVDSVQKGRKYKGTTHALFKKIIERHNKRVGNDKKFVVGSITVEDRDIILTGQTDEEQKKEEELETKKFDYEQIVLDSIVDNWQTSFDYIESCLIDYCGGYLRTRYVNGVTYIDLVTDYGNTAIQEIEFGINLLDLTEEVSAEDVFTVLIPLGDDNLTIAKVNNGSDELVDRDAVERYGRIVKTHVFDNVNSPNTLLENAKRFMKNHENLPITLTVKAVDMHLLDKDVKEIYVGDRVHVNSLPHNIVEYLVCTKVEYDINNPANNTYTFGNPKQTMTSRYRKDKAKQAKSSGSNGGKGGGAAGEAADEEANKKLDEFFDAWINVDKNAAHIDLGTLYKKYNGDRETLESSCGISLDAPTGNINIQTLRKEFDDFGVEVKNQFAGIDILNNEMGARIDLAASLHNELAGVVTNNKAEMLIHVDNLKADITETTEYIKTVDKSLSQSNTRIESISDELKAQIRLEVEHKKELDGKITSSNASIKEVATNLAAQITLEASHKNELDTNIAAIKVLANNNKSAIELKADEVTINAKLATINGKLDADEADIKKLKTDVANVGTLIANEIDSKVLQATAVALGSLTVKSLNISTSAYFKGNALATESWVNDQSFATQSWVNDQLANYAKKFHTHKWAEVTDKPSTFAPSAHTHAFEKSVTFSWGHTHKTAATFKPGNNTLGISNYSDKTITISGSTKANKTS